MKHFLPNLTLLLIMPSTHPEPPRWSLNQCWAILYH
jgi:hypothetical protein